MNRKEVSKELKQKQGIKSRTTTVTPTESEDYYKDPSDSNKGPVSVNSYYPYAMDRLDDAMSEIPLDDFTDLWKFISDDDNEQVNDVQEVIVRQHPRDVRLKGGKRSKNKEYPDEKDNNREEVEQLIPNPRTGAIKRIKSSTSSSNNFGSNPLLSSVLGISIE